MKRTPIRKVSKKQGAKNRAYSEAIRAKVDDFEYHGCQGCEENRPLTNSHLIPRSRCGATISDKDNIRHHCHECHDNYEAGRFDLLCDDELTYIANYLIRVDPELYHIKNEKSKERSGVDLDWYLG